MVKKHLIKKIENYLKKEYSGAIEKSKRFSFFQYFKLADDDDCDYDDSDDDCDDCSDVTGLDLLMSKLNIKNYIDESLEKITFAEKLNYYMYEKGLTTAIIYKRCMVDRKLISKITTQDNYHPSKNTVLALCIGLQLRLPEGEEFLSLAGYSFNKSSKYDLIIKFMLKNKIYDLELINEVLIYFGQPCFD